MRASHRTQGATLIATLLLVMAILAIIMVVTAQVTLSARRSSADQQQLLSARYAAESGVARVQGRLRIMKSLLDRAKIDATESPATIEGYMASLCGMGSLPSYTGTGSVTVCTFPATGVSSADNSNNPKVALFMNTVPVTAYADAGFSTTDDATRSRFWSEMLSGSTGTNYTGGTDAPYQARFGLVLSSLERTSDTSYRLNFTVPSLTSTGTSGSSTQNLSARSNTPGYYFEVNRQSLARYALFANHFFSNAEDETSGNRIYFTNRTRFSGPVHTNQQYTFAENPWFAGQVTSSGCPKDGISADGSSCTVATNPGAFYGSSSNFVSSPSSTLNDNGAAPSFLGGVVWNKEFTVLPGNSNDQNAAALSAGLPIYGTVTQMSLYRDTLSLGGGAASEVQRITYSQNVNGSPVTVQLAYGADQLLYIWDATSGTWVPAVKAADGSVGPGASGATPFQFNGVIAVQNDAAGNPGMINDLNGGPNVTADGPAGASVAAFARLNVTASSDIRVTSDLKYTDPPCTGSNVPDASGNVTATCNNLSAKNILGVYSSGGDVKLISPTADSNTRLGYNATIHAVLMASKGAVRVDGFNQGAPQGYVNLIGGIIENYYGAFGQFDSSGPVHGYGRNFVYDQRTYTGYAPPYFPTEKNWSLKLFKADSNSPVDADKGIMLQGDTVNAAAGWAP